MIKTPANTPNEIARHTIYFTRSPEGSSTKKGKERQVYYGELSQIGLLRRPLSDFVQVYFRGKARKKLFVCGDDAGQFAP